MNYDESVQWMSGLKRYGIKLGLDRFRELARRAGSPQDGLRCAHIAGTNGKGSTAAMIASAVRAAGLRCGLYLSPFVYDFRERIQINGEMIPKRTFARLAVGVRALVEELEPTEFGQATEFEAKTLVALLYFAEEGVDLASMEVGLGGRLDATNIVTPLVSVITNVSMDHMEHLGNTLPEIAAEKAGIIKRDVPVISAAESAEVCDVIRAAAVRCEAPLTWVREAPAEETPVRPGGDRIFYREHPGQEGFDLHSSFRSLLWVRPALEGRFQARNAGCALGALDAVVRQAPDVAEKLTDEAVRRGIETAWLPGRLEVVSQDPVVYADGAHNPDAARQLAAFLRERAAGRTLVLVIGMMSSHQPEDVVGELGPLADCIVATEVTGELGTHPVDVIARNAERVCSRVLREKDVREAVWIARSVAGREGLVCVTGSFYLLGRMGR